MVHAHSPQGVEVMIGARSGCGGNFGARMGISLGYRERYRAFK